MIAIDVVTIIIRAADSDVWIVIDHLFEQCTVHTNTTVISYFNDDDDDDDDDNGNDDSDDSDDNNDNR